MRCGRGIPSSACWRILLLRITHALAADLAECEFRRSISFLVMALQLNSLPAHPPLLIPVPSHPRQRAQGPASRAPLARPARASSVSKNSHTRACTCNKESTFCDKEPTFRSSSTCRRISSFLSRAGLCQYRVATSLQFRHSCPPGLSKVANSQASSVTSV